MISSSLGSGFCSFPFYSTHLKEVRMVRRNGIYGESD